MKNKLKTLLASKEMKSVISSLLCIVAGIFVMQIISNGMQLAGWGIYLQYAVKGIILLAAISFDAIKNRPRPTVRVHNDEEKKPELEDKA